MSRVILIFFFNDTATTEIYTLSLHDALPIYRVMAFSGPNGSLGLCLLLLLFRALLVLFFGLGFRFHVAELLASFRVTRLQLDRKSTRLNSSHANISYAVFCLKKKKNHNSHPS